MPITQTYQQLIDEIAEHNHHYYVENKPIISDYEYDKLFAELKKIEEENPWIISSNSPTQRLVNQISDGFEKAKHSVPLLSLENSYDEGDLRAWDEKIRKILNKNDVQDWKYCIEPKYDGISVELIYQNGILEKAITRGDGEVGEDITVNVKTIKTLDTRLKILDKVSVRGEIMMSKSKFKELNKIRLEAGGQEFSNTRNAAAGSIKLLDTGEVAKRDLNCFVYDILSIPSFRMEGEARNEESLIKKESLDKDSSSRKRSGSEGHVNRGEMRIDDLGLPTIEITNQIFLSIEEVIEFCLDKETKEKLENYDYDFDGLVIKVVNEGKAREILGQTHHHPRWAIAYKFPAQQASTQILSVDFQVGRSGIITPVANLEAVFLSGAEISRVSLHNFDFIAQKDIKIGDRVRIVRSGEVIPHILSVIKEKRIGEEDLISAPLFCPSCQGGIVNIDDRYYCTNPNCPGQLKEKILHFVSRDCMDVSGIGESLVESLMQQGILTSIADLYRLESFETQVLLKKLPGIGDKKISEIAIQLKTSKTQALWRLINGLGIPGVGTKLAKDVANFLAWKGVKSWDDIQKILLDPEQILQIEGIGEKALLSFSSFFGNQQTRKLLEELDNYGVKIVIEEREKGKNSGGSFSITGSFPMGRDEIKKQLEKSGYIFHIKPSKSTDFILMGEGAGKKADLAQDFGIKVYSSREEIQKVFHISPVQNVGKAGQQTIQSSLF